MDYDNQHGFFRNPRGFMTKYLWILEILAWIPRIPVYCLTDHHPALYLPGGKEHLYIRVILKSPQCQSHSGDFSLGFFRRKKKSDYNPQNVTELQKIPRMLLIIETTLKTN